jgi:fluoroquinolone transport system ATP-binding protein
MIQVDHLSFTYPGQSKPAVDNISFEVQQGEIFGFLGPSGAGKSTTQKILIRLLRGYSGHAAINGQELRYLDQDFYNLIGVGFELPNHYPKLSGLENLQFFASFYRKKTRNPLELLELVGLKDDARRPVSEYSKGMKMRLNFVRALIHDPDILFFDEPTSGLDPLNARRLKNIILELRDRGKTIFITTHNMHDADELCNRVAFITQGKISITGKPEDLKLQHGVRKLVVESGNGEVSRQEFPLDNLGENSAFLALLNREYIRSVHSAEATLEEVFIRTTGEKLY